MPTLLEFKLFLLRHAIDLFWIALILVGGKLIMLVIARRVEEISIDNAIHHRGRRKRAETLVKLLLPVGNLTIFTTAFIAFLQMFGIDPLPILAGASVFGFALGFGAQTLIRDFLSGIFIIMENQLAVGDRVQIGNVDGVVFKIGARSTVIIDEKGNFVFIPNGNIANVINYSLGDHHRQRGHEHH